MDENRALIVSVDQVPEIQVVNFEDLKERLNTELEQYRNFEVTEENIQEAKKVKAGLNGLVKQMEDERKRLKKIYETPLKDFESKVKVLTSEINEVSDAIKVQLDAYEEIRKEKKENILRQMWSEIGGEIPAEVSYDIIAKPSWLNASTSNSKIADEMRSAAREITSNITLINTIQTDHRDRILGCYLRTLDIRAALQEDKHAEEEKAKAAEVKENLNHVKFIPVLTEKPREKEEIPEKLKRKDNITFTVYDIDYVQFTIISTYLEQNGYDVKLEKGGKLWQ